MNFRRKAAVLGCSVALTAIVVAATAGVAAAGDLEKMQGTWRGRAEIGGDLTLVIDGNHVKSTMSGRGGSATTEYDIKLDESTDPKSIDYLNVDSTAVKELAKKEENTQVLDTHPRGIYKWDGEKLIICMDPFGKLPTKFGPGKGGGIVATYARKELPKEETKAAKAVDLGRLQGDWTAKIGFGKDRQTVRLNIQDQKATLTADSDDKPEVLAESEFTLDETVRPRRIQFKPTGTTQSKLLSGKAAYLISKNGDGFELHQRTDGAWPKDMRDGDKQQLTQFRRPAGADAADTPADDAPPAKKPFKQPRRPTGKAPKSRPTPK